MRQNTVMSCIFYNYVSGSLLDIELMEERTFGSYYGIRARSAHIRGIYWVYREKKWAASSLPALFPCPPLIKVILPPPLLEY